jgi:hypothetical protein
MPRQIRRGEEEGATSQKRSGTAVIPVIAEQATIRKRVVETAKVHIAKRSGVRRSMLRI